MLELLAEHRRARSGSSPTCTRTTWPRCARHPGHPGEEAPREELWGLTATLRRRRARGGSASTATSTSSTPARVPWRHGPWSGAVEDGVLHGRGAVDMKAAVVAALHAAAALRAVGAARARRSSCSA